MRDPIAHRALYQEVADRLRRLIHAGELAPGAFIDELALAGSFGISRTPLREALKVLHAEGLVRLTPRRGSFVAGELTPADLDDLFPVLALLEGRCAYEAVRQATPAEVRRLDALHARLERLAARRDVTACAEQIAAFHEALQALAGNPWLTRLVSGLRRLLELLRGRQLLIPGRLEASLEAHRRLMRALHRRDAAAAERIMRAHLLAQRAALAAQERDAPQAAPAPRGARAGPGAPPRARRRQPVAR